MHLTREALDAWGSAIRLYQTSVLRDTRQSDEGDAAMHLTREAINLWAAGAEERMRRSVMASDHRTLIRLEEGDSMRYPPPMELLVTGPALVELVVYRDGGWSARELVYETPESIALAASLAQRGTAYSPRNEISDRWSPR